MAKPDLQQAYVEPTTGKVKTLDASKLGDSRLNHLTNAANDGAAATAGVAIGELYRNGSVLMIRVA